MLIAWAVLAGLVAGSFANVCIWRLPREESLWRPGSQCPACKTSIRFYDNIPLLSFILLRRRCRHCREPISAHYPAVEGLMGLLFGLAAWRYETTPSMVVLACWVTFHLVTISIIDYRHRIIPDELSFSLLLSGLAAAYWNPFLEWQAARPVVESLVASITGGLFMLVLAYGGEKLFKQEALGGGDIKLIAAFGAILGWSGVFGAMLIGSITGGLVGLVLILSRRKSRKETMPFGPFLCLGAYATCLSPIFWGRVLFS